MHVNEMYFFWRGLLAVTDARCPLPLRGSAAGLPGTVFNVDVM